MLVITAMIGCRYRTAASDSSAWATMNSPVPSLAFAPLLLSLPPITKVGSKPPLASTLAASEVVVVLPCVPATAMPWRRRINSASIIARGTTGMRRARAASTSGLSWPTAVDTTTASASVRCCSAWPRYTVAPSCLRRCVTAFSLRSEPLTWKPRLSSTSAMPFMPEPPMPTKWRCLTLCFIPKPHLSTKGHEQNLDSTSNSFRAFRGLYFLASYLGQFLAHVRHGQRRISLRHAARLLRHRQQFFECQL